MKTHTKEFDEEFDKIEHFERFPAMRPYVGINYETNLRSKILIIGESNYLPQYSTLHLDAENWFKSKQAQLNNEEINWIHCRKLLECEWNNKGHRIYKELESVLSCFFKTNGYKAMTNVSYMNGFQRPSPKAGDSIGKYLSNSDIKISADVISQVISIINPDLIIFVSKLAWDKLRWKICIEKGKHKLDFTCHPATGGLYWHKKDYKDGKEKFKRILKQNLKTLEV